jgi:hypothetical protein
VPVHPHDHVGDHGNGEQPDHRLQALLLALRQILGQHLHTDRDHDADGGGGRDPVPDLTQCVPPAVPAQEGRDDAYDEGGLEPLP